MTVITPSAMARPAAHPSALLRLAQVAGLVAAAVLVGLAMMLGA